MQATSRLLEARGSAIAQMVRALRQRGTRVEELFQGLDLDLEALEDPSLRVEWERMATLVERIEVLAGGPGELRSLCGELTRDLMGNGLRGVAGIAISLEQLYRLFIGELVPCLFPIDVGTIEASREGWLRIRASIPPERVGCSALFRAIHGALETLPRFHGLENARVEAEITSHAAEYRVRLRAEELSARREQRDAAEVAELAIQEITRRRRELSALEGALSALQVELGRATEALKSAQRLASLGEIAGGIAHQFNNHLVAASWSLDMLRPMVEGNHRAEELVAALEEGVAHEKVLTAQLVTLSRRRALQPAPLDPNRAIEELRGFLGRLVTDVEIRTELSRDVGGVYFDPIEFQRVLVCLVSAGRRDGRAGGSVEIRTERIVLADRGEARRPHVRVRISHAEPDAQAPQEAVSVDPSSCSEEALGGSTHFAAARGLLEEHGGRIRIVSEPGRGPCFHIELPQVLT